MLEHTEDIEKLIKSNEGLVWKQLHKFNLQKDPDAISLAMEALYNSILTFNHNKNTVLSTYATVCIYNTLGGLCRSRNTLLANNTVYGETPLTANGEFTLFDTLESEHTADETVLHECRMNTLNKAIQDCIAAATSDTSRAILELWVASEYTMTTPEISRKLKCSQSYAVRVINNFRQSLKKKLEVD